MPQCHQRDDLAKGANEWKGLCADTDLSCGHFWIKCNGIYTKAPKEDISHAKIHGLLLAHMDFSLLTFLFNLRKLD